MTENEETLTVETNSEETTLTVNVNRGENNKAENALNREAESAQKMLLFMQKRPLATVAGATVLMAMALFAPPAVLKVVELVLVVVSVLVTVAGVTDGG